MTDEQHRDQREGRRLALGAVFEADFGQATATSVLERRIDEEGATAEAAAQARQIVASVTAYRDTIDARIGAVAPAYPVGQLARMDRALLRSAIAELLHSPTTPARVAISEWVELARTYSGDPARRLVNGVLGRVSREATSDRTARGSKSGSKTHKQPEPEPNHSRGSAE